MIVRIVHENGKIYDMPVSQVSVHTENGDPCMLAYEHANLIVCSHVNEKDFERQCAQLKIDRIEVPHA